MKLKPLHDWVVIERQPETSELGGIFVPGSPSNQGAVIAIGHKVREVAVGDLIQFNPFAGYVIKAESLNVTFIHESDITIILDGKTLTQ